MANLGFSGPPQIDPSEIELGEKIGEGCFGTVYIGRCRTIDVAIKVPKNQNLDEEQLDAFCKEVEIMSNIYAPNINLFMGACTIPGNIMIVTELMEGDLETLLRNKNYPVPLYDRLKMARDAAQGVAWLHGSNPTIVHRDLKTSNLLFDKNKRIKVCDFGFSQLFPRGKKMVDLEGAKGTPLYMAPEVMMGEEFNEKADVYSFGIVLWEILTRKEPFSHHTDFDKFAEAVCEDHERPPLPDDCLPSLRNLICRCWADNPGTRPSFPQIVDALEEILVDCAVDDDTAKQMWKLNFLRKEYVSWREEFVPTFAATLGTRITRTVDLDRLIDSVEYRCLAAVLVDRKDNDSVVNLVKFGQILNWFGPMRDPDGKCRILETVKHTLSQSWFHGHIEYEDAVHKLKNKPPGTFLIRFSSNAHPGCYTISKVSAKNKIMHTRVQHKPGGDFTIINDSTNKVSHRNKTLWGLVHDAQGPLNLKTSPESPYIHLFPSEQCNVDSLYQAEDDNE